MIMSKVVAQAGFASVSGQDQHPGQSLELPGSAPRPVVRVWVRIVETQSNNSCNRIKIGNINLNQV